MLLKEYGIFPVREFGATGNGKTKDAKAIQKAIDECSGEDGSRILPAPLYAKYIDGLQACNVRVHWDDNLKRTWLKAIWFEQCKNVEGSTKVEK